MCLCKDKNGYRSFRLSKIEEILFLNETSSFNDEEIAHFKKMIKYGPQYIYTSKDEEVEIELTKKGINYFKKYYVYRPIVDRIEGYHYFFNCSIEHLFQYFSRFGAECYVIKPKSLRVRLIMYFKNSYRELNKKEKTI